MKPRYYYQKIPLSNLIVSPCNDRSRYGDRNINTDDLEVHIEKHGLVEPIIVYSVDEIDSVHPLYDIHKPFKGNYAILSGFRRFRVFVDLNKKFPNSGWDTIECLIREPPEDETDAIAISLGGGLTQLPFTLADSIDACNRLFMKYCDAKIVSRKTGISVKLIERYVKFNRLPKLLQDNLPMIHKNNKTAVLLAVEATDALGYQRGGEVPEEKVLELAKSLGKMKSKGNGYYKKMKRAAEENPKKSISEIEDIALKIELPRKISIEFDGETYEKLNEIANDQGLDILDEINEFLDEWIKEKTSDS